MKILHYYHDLMNLYGDYANVSAMRRILEKSGESVTVDRRSLGDNVDFSDYDFIYIGSGTERNQRVALADLHRHADALRQYIADGKPALLTGNSFEMLGRTITDAAGNKHKGLGVFDFTVTEHRRRDLHLRISRRAAGRLCQQVQRDQGRRPHPVQRQDGTRQL